MNKLIESFLNNNYYKIDILKNTPMLKAECISPIVSAFGIYKNEKNKKIFIADIKGNSISISKSENIMEELIDLFREHGEPYYIRANNMLQYTSENVIQQLNYSFIKDPITINEITKGVYLVSGDGRHRYALLMVHYLNELCKCKTDKEIENIKTKYMIPMKVSDLDIIKTYCQYLIFNANPDLSLEEELNDYVRTGKTCIQDLNGNVSLYNDMELIEFTKSIICKIPKHELKNNLKKYYTIDEYFKEFIDNYFTETIIEEYIRNSHARIK